ncbi:ABC transporter ATP-binding protein/permease [Psychromarinibacter halotolerans]|uniref:ABC transporter ATP-binding protein/permease n=1 Tax=Psychromarinibacter halotolerans TaxID=1775175 RepID=A0ABV7GPH9_9RHOB|nr:SbmA/BacA-like family transporter [Psychromarinibacter halotolerans]MDF0595667.1 SbmA/BacA-like family transporter [Psychromarinibacter halotolerans]
MPNILKRIWRLTWLAASGPQAWIGLVLFGTVFALIFVELWVDVQMIAWTGRFYDAVEQMDVTGAVHELGVFAVIVGALAGINLTQSYLRDWLRFRWRARLTHKTLDAWLGGQAYWHLRPGLSPDAIDNPDQRVAEDCNRYVELLLQETLDLIGRIVGLVTYIAILWSLSDFVLRFSLLGVDVAVPRYMVWLAFVYVLVASFITHGLGYPLKSIFFRQERREADFRHALVQLRDNATEVAQSGGEEAERRRLSQRFEAIRQNWFRLIGREFILGIFTRPYWQTILRVPLFFALPAYFAGSVTFGGLMQLSSTFSRVTTSLSWFIFSYRDLAEFAAVAHRLDDLFRMTDGPEPMPAAPCAIQRAPSGDGALHVRGLRLATPDGRWLDAVPDRTVRRGDRVWLAGDSGQGKTTLLAAVSGLWRYGEGRIETPKGRMMVLPQRPHLFSDGLRAAACYPADPDSIADDRLRDVLDRLGLSHRLGALDADGEASLEGLSLGERQRLALARVLLHRPDWVVLDEATSSLDAASEAHLLAILRRDLPDAAILCVAHREPTALEPTHIWRIGAASLEQRKSA